LKKYEARKYEMRWLENNKLYTRVFLDRTVIIYDFKKCLLEQDVTHIDLYYKNKLIASYDKESNIDWETEDIIFSKMDIINMNIELDDINASSTFEDMVLDNDYIVNRYILLQFQINYCLDIYPLNKEELIKLSKEYNKINEYLELTI